MRIQHNIMAMNAYRNYSNNTSALSKNLEKLSSGYKINRAGDDAAGLAISEKMRAQITGLETAQKNAKDGISLVQTAEGALTEVHDMLNRMYELAEQSANGTYQNEVDRAQLQKEVDSLREEINRIADTANFNGIQLFTGAGATDTDAAATVEATLDQANAAKLGAGTGFAFDASASAEVKEAFTKALGADGAEVKVGLNVAAAAAGVAAGDTIKLSGLPTGYAFKFTDASGAEATVTDGTGLTVGTNAGEVAAADAQGTLALTAYDADGNKVGTLSIDLSGVANNITAGAEQTTTVTLAAGTGKTDAATKTRAADGADAANGPTFTADGGLNLATFGLDSLDFSGAANPDAEADVEIEYDGTNLIVTVGADKYTAAMGDTAANLAGTELELKNANGDTIKAKVAAGNTVIGNDVPTTINAAKAGTLAPAQADADDGAEGDVDIPEGEIWLQIGEDGKQQNRIKVEIGKIDTATLKIDAIDIGTQSGALNSLTKIKDAINTISDIRGGLGATQNRLEHTINNLSVMTENIQDAEATIRDTDVADEMMAYTKNNILVQSAQAMLAQANQVPQGVLQLLQ